LLDLFRLHLSLYEKYSNEETQQFKALRRFFKIYIRGIKGASQLRHKLMSTETIDEARELLDEFEAKRNNKEV
ncbi:tRNA-dihydrouridine synthase, partial [Staphylococcus caprae]